MSAELLSPAGDFATALSAFAAGADAVYCGLPEFSARAYARNFSKGELSDLVSYAHSPDRGRRRRVYVTFNTLVDESRLEAAAEALSLLEEIGPDAVIVQDLGIARMCRRFFPGLELHASTQLVAHNLEGVLALKEAGFRRVVPSRELTLAEIGTIARRCGAMKTAADSRPETEIECFIHGALCYSVSGLCLFGAMEKGRSGNRGECPYCCRLKFGETFPFSMKDLRLDEGVKQLESAGVSSLKIEGRMKSPLYVAAVTRYYRNILDGVNPADGGVTREDVETVFSRRTTRLYFDSRPAASAVIDPSTVGHVGAFIGTVKKITRDRDGDSYLRLHTTRALEKHDGLEFDVMTDEGRRMGFGISAMRLAISRRRVFEVPAHSDVEILVTDDIARALVPGCAVYCSMSNAVKRMFPPVTCRGLDCAGTRDIDVSVSLRAASATGKVISPFECSFSIDCSLSKAERPEGTLLAAEKAFSRLGGTPYRLRSLSIEEGKDLFAPASVLNALRRGLVEELGKKRAAAEKEKLEAVFSSLARARAERPKNGLSVAKIRLGDDLPPGEWDEVVVAIGRMSRDDDGLLGRFAGSLKGVKTRLATGLFTPEDEFGRQRVNVKRLVRAGYAAWECSDLATLRLLKECGVDDITADWSLYAFNSQALEYLCEEGVSRFVASPENTRGNLEFLSASGYDVEFLARQSTPLFISMTEPGKVEDGSLRVFNLDGMWITVKEKARVFDLPPGGGRRYDFSWDCPRV